MGFHQHQAHTSEDAPMNRQRSPVSTAPAHKRGQGGSIYQRSDGRWVGTIMLGFKPDGKSDRPDGKCPTVFAASACASSWTGGSGGA